MKNVKLIVVLSLTTIFSTDLLGQTKNNAMETITLKERAALTCKLTTKELQNRKQTVLTDLKNNVLTKNEFKDGFEYTFSGTDKVIDQLTEFIKTERQCCDFFNYEIKISGDIKETVTLKITGPDGVKDFIKEELGL